MRMKKINFRFSEALTRCGVYLLMVIGFMSFSQDATAQCHFDVEVCNQGPCPVRVYEWLNTGDVFLGIVQAGSCQTYQGYDGIEMRYINDNHDWNNLSFDEHENLTGCFDRTRVVTPPNYCGASNVCNLVVDLGEDLGACDNLGPISPFISGESQCTGGCTVDQKSTLVTWTFNQCVSWANDPTTWDYSEFDPYVNGTGGCSDISGSDAYRIDGWHSCATGYNDPKGTNGDMAMCTNYPEGLNSWSDNHSYANRFSITMTPGNGKDACLTELQFREKASYNIDLTSSTTNGIARTKQVDYPRQYGVRITVGGQEVFQQIGINTSSSWSLETLDLSSAGLCFSNATTLDIEILPYNFVDNKLTNTWEIDHLQLFGGCCTRQAANTGLSYVWIGPGVTGSNASSITPTQPGTYSVQVTDCQGCVAQDEIVISNISTSVTLGGDQLVCGGAEATLTATADSPCMDLSCCSRVVSSTGPNYCGGGEDTDYVLYLAGGTNGIRKYAAQNVSWTECSDGTARLTGTARHAASGDVFVMDIYYGSGTSNPPMGSPKPNACDAPMSGLYYYETTTGTITNSSSGHVIHVSRRGAAMQLGQGANATSTGFGASGWLGIDDSTGDYTKGDINIMLSQACADEGPQDGTYAWSDGSTGSSITVTTPGEYCVTYTDCYGCTATDCADINLSTITVDAGADQKICLGEQATLTASAGASYLWSTGNGIQTITVEPTTTTTYSVTVTDAEGCTGVDEIIVEVNNAVWTNVTATALTGCDANDGTINVDPDVSEGTSLPIMVTYVYNGSTITAGPFSDNNTNLITGLAPGDYTQITMIDDMGCTAVWPGVVTVEEPASPVADAGGDVLICLDEIQDIALQGSATSGTAPYSYSWTGPGISVANMNDQTPTVSVAGTYTLVVTDANACTASDVVIVTTSTLETVVEGPTQRCAGETAQFQANPPLPGVTYNWTFTGNPTIDAVNTMLVLQ